jgi:5-formyltetrahydrofolate cyclo-ligase
METKDESRRGEKHALRRRMRELRRAMSPEERLVAAARVEEHLFDLPVVVTAETIMLFYAFGSEIPTAAMAQRVVSEGKRLLLPFLEGDRIEAAEVGPGDPLVQASYGPKEPARRVPMDPAGVGLVVTPGLAFDRSGHRLGYGGGYYDGYLRRLSTPTVRIGIGFSEQLVDRVPHDSGDQRVDLVVTDAGVIECLPRG